MRNWKLLVGVLGLALLLAALAVVWLRWPRLQIDAQSRERIKKGMTLAEVEDIIGAPPGVYTDLSTFYWMGLTGPPRKIPIRNFLEVHSTDPDRKSQSWYGDKACIVVDFDDDGKVRYVHLLESVRQPALTDKARVWLGW